MSDREDPVSGTSVQKVAGPENSAPCGVSVTCRDPHETDPCYSTHFCERPKGHEGDHRSRDHDGLSWSNYEWDEVDPDGSYDSDHAESPQCPAIGENYAGKPERCLRREGHPGAHMGMGSE